MLQFGKKVVRVLAVYQFIAPVRFAGLVKQRVTACANGKGIKREHGVDSKQPVFAHLALCHIHKPVWGIKLAATAAAFVK
jgi:hypothetical protein